MNRNKYLLYLMIFASLPFQMICEQTTQNHTITVFVHGTTPIRRFLEHTFLRPLIYCQQGLSLAKNLPKNYHFYQVAQGCVDDNPESYCLDQFYLFGWKSERINNATRMQAAAELVKALQDVVNTYYLKHNAIPKLQLIGFSHGGNVVLHTANYLPLLVKDKPIDIDVWLFATPIQRINQLLVNSKYFNNVYSIYSKKDWIQRMDPQGLLYKEYRKDNFWSDRTFDPTHHCIQVNFTVNNKSISHTYYRTIFKHFPTIKRLIQELSKDLRSGMIAFNLEI